MHVIKFQMRKNNILSSYIIHLVFQTIILSPTASFISSLISPILKLLTGDPDDWDVFVWLVSLLVMLDWFMELMVPCTHKDC